MVRVISVHHFSKQEVSTCSPANPNASVMAGKDFLVMATENQYMEVRDLDKGSRISHSFQGCKRNANLVNAPFQ